MTLFPYKFKYMMLFKIVKVKSYEKRTSGQNKLKFHLHVLKPMRVFGVIKKNRFFRWRCMYTEAKIIANVRKQFTVL